MGSEIPTFIVVGLSGVTRMDLTGTIEQAIPNAQVLSAKTFMDAAEKLRDIATLAGAIIRSGAKEFQESDLAKILHQTGSRIVLMGEMAEDEADRSPFPVLQRPFAMEDVLRALEIKH